MEKIILIGNQALEIARLKKQIELMEEKVGLLWLKDVLSHDLKYHLKDDDFTSSDYRELIEKEKEEK